MRLLVPLLSLVGATIVPFALAQAGGWGGNRPFYVELGSSTGIAALAVLAIVLVLPTRLRALAGIGADAAVRLHRHLVGVLLALIAAHVVLAVGVQPARYVLMRFIGEPWRAQAAVSSIVCLLLLILLSVWRRPLGLSYAAWRFLHGAMAAGTLLFAALHTFGWHRYLGHGAGLVALLVLVAVPLGALCRLRSGARARRVYHLDEVIPEGGASTTLVLRARDRDPRGFAPGQFAWLRLADHPGGFAEHPFSYTSDAADPRRISFTIRAYEGFSRRAAALPRGTRFVVDGPHGAFQPRRRARGIVLLAYGIGITPAMSILRTAAGAGDNRRFIVFYANRTSEDIAFGRALSDLRASLRLDVVHVLSRPSPEWMGERGRIDHALLSRHLPASVSSWDFLVCGAGAPVESGVSALAKVGIPPERVHAERFVAV